MPIIIGAGVGLVGGIGKMVERGRANRELRGLMKTMPQYKENPLYGQRLGLAQTLLNARMPGAAAAERNIYQTEANQLANAQRAASSGNELLLAGAGAAGQANQAFGQLGQMEAADYQRRYGNLTSAQEAQAAEQQKVYEDQLRRYQTQAQLQGAIQENRAATWGDIGNLGMGVASMGVNGAFGNLGGAGKSMLTNRNPMTQTPISASINRPNTINQPSIPSSYMGNYTDPLSANYVPQSLVGNWWNQ